MDKFTLMLIPPKAKGTRQFSVPLWVFHATAVFGLVLIGSAGYLIFDYLQMRRMRHAYFAISAENEGLKGEARVLMTNLDDVKKSLSRVQDYTSKLTEITQVTVNKVSAKTGIGPLSPEEYKIASKEGRGTNSFIPAGLNLKKLFFRPVFDNLHSVSVQSKNQAYTLKTILSNLSKQRSLLASVPSISPVNGWVTSGFGYRTSPFTKSKTMHKGIDIASPIGTPIYSPADGVVIFTGNKAGFGNFVMIAHGYGIVSRFGHNAQNMVQPGQQLKRGEQIATVGMSGRTTGPHLHYEILVNGRYMNPRKFILNLAETFTAH